MCDDCRVKDQEIRRLRAGWRQAADERDESRDRHRKTLDQLHDEAVTVRNLGRELQEARRDARMEYAQQAAAEARRYREAGRKYSSGEYGEGAKDRAVMADFCREQAMTLETVAEALFFTGKLGDCAKPRYYFYPCE